MRKILYYVFCLFVMSAAPVALVFMGPQILAYLEPHASSLLFWLFVVTAVVLRYQNREKPPAGPAELSDEQRETQWLIQRWFDVAEQLGLAVKINSPEYGPYWLAPTVDRVEFPSRDTRRLTLALPPGLTRDDFAVKTEHLAGAFGMESAEVERDTGRADVVRVLLLRPNSVLSRDLPRSANPALTMQSGADPLAPVILGQLSSGQPLALSLFETSWLVGGSPGSGKSVFLQQLLATAALMRDCELWLLDPKEVELAFWEDRATRLVRSPEVADHITALEDLVAVMDARYAAMRAAGSRKAVICPETPLVLLVVDELAELTASGNKKECELAGTLIRRLVAKGRAAGICVVCATQKPAADTVPSALRDLFGYRIAFRCGTDAQSDTILGAGQARLGGDASRISTDTRGVGLVLGDGERVARRFKAYHLLDDDLVGIANRAIPDSLTARRWADPGPCQDPAHAALALMDTPRECPNCSATRRYYLIDDEVASCAR